MRKFLLALGALLLLAPPVLAQPGPGPGPGPVPDPWLVNGNVISYPGGVVVGAPTGSAPVPGAVNVSVGYAVNGSRTAQSATGPLVLDPATGIISCPSCSTGTGGALTNGVTTTSGYTNTQILGSNGTVLSAYSVSGTGNVVLGNSPSITTPSFVFGTGATSVINAASTNTGFANEFQVTNGGVTSNSGTLAGFSASFSALAGSDFQFRVTGAANPFGQIFTDTGLTGGLSIAAFGGPLNITNPVLSTPTLGVAKATSLAVGGATIGSNALAVTGTATFNSAVQFPTVGVFFTNATSGSINVAAPTGALGSAVLTLPDVTDTLTANAATQTLSHKTFSDSNFITLSNLVQSTSGAQFLGVTGASAANYAPFTLSSLTNLPSPSSTLDLLPIVDHSTGTIKNVNASQLLAAIGGGVTSVNGQAGALVNYYPPQGRLTLTSGTPRMTTSVAAATTVYYTSSALNMVPIFDGTNVVPTPFPEVSQSTTDTTKSPAAVIPNATYDIFGWIDPTGSVKRVTRSDYWKRSATVTMTVASPAVVTWTGNTFADGTPIVFATTGALPTGLVAGTTYFVKQTALGVISNTFNVAATVGGSAINTTGTQSGTQTGTAADDSGAVARASGGNSELDFASVLGLPLNKNAITNGPVASRGTWLGTIRSNSSGTIDYIFGAPGSGGVAASFMVWNAYGRLPTPTTVTDTGTSYNNYSSTTPRQARGSAGNQVSLVTGTAGDPVQAAINSQVFTVAVANAFSAGGIGVNTTSAFSFAPVKCAAPTAASVLCNETAPVFIPASLGLNVISRNEAGDGTNLNGFDGGSADYLSVAVWN